MTALAIVPKPWERQPVDTDESWEAFKLYLDLKPPRRQRAVIGYRTASVGQWWNDCSWPERAAAWDAHTFRIQKEEEESILRQSAQVTKAKHLHMLHTASDIVQRELDKLLSDLKKQGDASCAAVGGLLKPPELIKLMEKVVSLQRLVYGESTDNVAHVHMDLSKLSPEELRTLREIRSKIDAQDQDEQDPVPALQEGGREQGSGDDGSM